MGDRTSVTFVIGGQLDRAHLPAFLDAIEAEGFGLDWSYADRDNIAAAIDRAMAEGGSLEITGQEVNYANAPEIEQFCQAQGLSYRKMYDAGGGYCAGVEIYDHATKRLADYVAANGDAVLDPATFSTLSNHEAVTEWFKLSCFAPESFKLTP